MVWLLLVGIAFAGKWDDKVADVVATKTIAVPPSAVFPYVADWKSLSTLYPTDCALDWEIGDPSTGEGATARMTYRAGKMVRRLPARIAQVKPDRLVDLEHTGKKGFTTRFLLEEAAGGGATKVTMTTYLAPPPWPVKGYYYKKVQPAWTSCHERTLENLATEAVKGGSAGEPGPSTSPSSASPSAPPAGGGQ